MASQKEGEADCADCTFNISKDDEQVRCEFLKMLGKSDPACDKYQQKEDS